jgi:hypothetical protein
MKLIFPSPELKWSRIKNQYFLHNGDGDDHKEQYVGIIYVSDEKYYWNIYSYFNFSPNDIGAGEASSSEEAKNKIEEALIAAGIISK